MKHSICIIDDDMLYKLLLKKTISNLPISVDITCFSNGKEALDAFSNSAIDASELPDIILLDINMPIMDGWEFMESFVELLPTLPKVIRVYIASSSIANQDIEKAKLYKEISEYLVKPIHSETLYNILVTTKSQQNKTLTTLSAHQQN